MPVYSVREYAELCQIEPKNVHTYAARGKVVKNNLGQIDTANPLNKSFLDDRKIDTTQDKKTRTKTKKKTDNKPVKEITEELSPYKINQQEALRIDLEIKKKNLELTEIKLAQSKGKLVDLEQTGNIISQYVLTTNKMLSERIETFIQDICSRNGIESSKAGGYKLKVKDIINEINEKGVSEVFKQLEL